MSKRILITAGRSPLALEFARQLHQLGHTIIIAETTKRSITKYSKSVAKCVYLPSPRENSEAFLDALINIIINESIELYIPIFEEAFYVAKNIDRFPKSCKIFCDHYQKLKQLHNKLEFNDLLQQYGLAQPETKQVTSLDEVTPYWGNKKKYLLKKIYTHAAQDIYYSNKPLDKDKINISESDPWILQEFIEGNKYCSYSICHNGEVKASSTYPVEFSIDNSSCVYYQSVNHQKILDWIIKFVRNTNLTGQVGFDFIETKDGTLYAIECNPRPTAGVHLFETSDQIDRAFLNTNQEIILPKSEKPKMLAMGMLLYGWRTPKELLNGKSFLKSFLNAQDVVYKKGDSKPFIMQFFLYTTYAWKAAKLKLSLSGFFYHDLVWIPEKNTKSNDCPIKLNACNE